MSTCEAKTRIELAEIEVDRKEAELKEAKAELAQAREEFKIPAFFRNMTGVRLNPRKSYATHVEGIEKPYQKWMMNELQKYDAFPRISGYIVFSDNPVEKIYNIAIAKIDDMKGHPVFPDKFIPKRS
jgi:hypothetical protein